MPEMAEPIAKEYRELTREAYRLHWNWQLYRTLFGTSERRYRMLEAVAADAFRKIDLSFLEGVVLSLCRLGDKRRDTLSLRKLQDTITKYGDSTLAAETAKHLVKFQAKCQELEMARNERIAHLNRAAALDNWQGLNFPSRQTVEESLEHVRLFLNTIEIRYSGQQHGYGILSPCDDSDQLVQVLKWGLRYQDLLLSGAIPHEDGRNSEWSDA